MLPPLQTLQRWRHPLLVLCLLVATVANFLAHRHFYFEDSFITFRYAENLANGLGLVFNPGERVLGASSALYTLLLAFLAWLGFDVVDAGGFVYAACLSATGYIVARFLARCGYPNAGVFFALLAVWGVGGTLRFFGMETALYLLLIVASVAMASRAETEEGPLEESLGEKQDGAFWATGILLGLTCLTRYDGMVVAFVVGLYLWHRRRRPPWAEAFIASALFGSWLLFAFLYFGSPLPNTLGAKAGDSTFWGYLAASWRDIQVALYSPLNFRWQIPSWQWRFGLLALSIGPALFFARRTVKRRPSLAMLPGIAILLLVGYAVIGPPLEHAWYQMPTLYCLLAFGVACWGEGLRQARPKWLSRTWTTASVLGAIAVSLVAIPWTAPLEGAFHRTAGPPGRIEAYRQFADWILDRDLAKQSGEPTSILTHEPGFLTFHTGQRAIDAAGLVTKDIFFHGPQTRRSDLFHLIRRFDPEFIVLKLDRNIVETRLSDRYVRVSTGMPALTLFMRRSLYEAEAERLQAPWIAPPSGRPAASVVDSDSATSAAGWTLLGEPFDSASGTGIAWTGELPIDFDEISFDFEATSPETRLQVLVDDTIVWDLGERGRAPGLQREVLALYPWRDRRARMRLFDADDTTGYLNISNLRLNSYRSKTWLEDFEGPTANGFWSRESQQPSLVVSNRPLGLRLEFQQTQGHYLTSTVGQASAVRRFSRPFLLAEERLQMMVYDFGGPETSLSLWVDGERVRHFKGTNSQQLRMLRWGVKDWLGREAVLQIRDQDGETEKGLAVDGLLLYTF